MALLMEDAVGLGQADLISSADPKQRLGQRAVDDTGRSFRYVKAGSLALVAGNVLQSPVIVTAHLANTPPAVAAGATTFVYTPGAATAVADFYQDGFLQVDTTPGEGYTYTIAGHAAIASSTAFTLNLKDQIQVALTTSTRVGLLANKYRGVIQFPATTATGTAVGVATYIIGANQYGWVATWGQFSVLIAGTPAHGAMVMAPAAVAGAVTVVVAAGSLLTAQVIGQMAQIGVDTKLNFVDIRITP